MKVLVLAGGFDQIALIKELQLRGHEVILADYLENPPAQSYVEKHYKVSTLDEDAIYHLALKEDVGLLTTACTDQALLTVAKVSEKLRLPCYLNFATAQNVTDKAFMKRKFKEYHIPTAEWMLLEEDTCKGEWKNHLEFPVIVKPCDSNSSKGVTKVQQEKQLEAAVDNAFIHSRSKKVIIERLMEGKEISVDIWKDNEKAKILLISETNKMKTNEENFTIYQSKYPAKISDVVKQKIQDISEKICKAFEIENSPILIQAIVNGNDVKVIECSARMGGGSKYKFIEHITGVDIMQIYVNRILGNTTQNINPSLLNKVAEINYVYAYNGIFDKCIGYKENVEMGNICEVFQYKLPGSVIQKRTTSSDRILGFLLEADTYEELEKKRCEVLNHVDILDINGKSMMYRECFS